MIRQPSFHDANAAAGFGRTSAGLEKCRSSYSASSMRWSNAQSFMAVGHRALWSHRRALSLTLAVVPERSTWDRRTLRTHPRLENAIGGKRVKYCLSCYPRFVLPKAPFDLPRIRHAPPLPEEEVSPRHIERMVD
jgi:hypothetical protein